MPRILAVLTVFCWTMTALAGNWPGWRGATGQGHAEEKDVPSKWGPTENIRWKVALPDAGNSSPIVWGDRVFLTQASDKKLWPPQKLPGWPSGTSVGGPAILERRSVMCFHRADGKLLWQRDTRYDEPESTHGTAPMCNATPVTDGARVIASHGSAGMVCYDFLGNELWKKDLGKLEHVWGNASSPILYGELCILWCGPGERQVLVAVDKKTGATVWEHHEPGGHSGRDGKKFTGSWSTPTIGRVGGQDQLILSVPGKLKGFDPKTGKEIWAYGTSAGGLVYHSPVFADGIAVTGGTAVQLGAKGDITRNRLWSKAGASVGSGLIAGDYFYVHGDGGAPRCYELKTGKELWDTQIEKRPGTTAWGSLVHAAGKLYITDQGGTTLVYAAGPKFELKGANRLNEHVNASIAISNGEIFIRTWKHLWCISEKK